MVESSLDRRPHGNIVLATGGYSAFVPAALPPPIGWNATLAVSLSTADRSIGRLAGEARHLPNPDLLVAPFIRKEAVLSSRIEGTRTTLGELLAAEAGAPVERSAADLREVVNYVTALEYGLRRLDSLPLSLRLVRELHERLMRGIRGDSATPGEFRRSQNWIGSPGSTLADATYVPPPPSELFDCLSAWERFLHDDSLPPLVHAAFVHAQFEAIHPFFDGNGRVGRLLITLILAQRGVLPQPLLYLSAYFERTRQDYYSHLLNITECGEWEEWLVYFLNGVTVQSEETIEKMLRIYELLSEWKLDLERERSRLPERALEQFVANPLWTVGALAERMEVAYPSAHRAINRLVELGAVSLVGEARRNRVYCAQSILDVLGEP